MAPTAIDTETQVPIHTKVKSSTHREPLELSSALDQYEKFDVTPIIGREFPKANLVEWLDAPNSDELLRDLAITSMSHPIGGDDFIEAKMLTLKQSLSAALSFSVLRTT